MKRPKILFIILCLHFLPLCAQDKSDNYCPATSHFRQPPHKMGGKQFSPQQFQKQEEQYILRHTSITQAQAKIFFPIFHRFKQQLRDFEHKKFRLLQQSEDKNISDSLSMIILQQINQQNNDRSELMHNYQQQALQYIGPSLLLQIHNADRHFERYMIRDAFNGKHKKGSRKPYMLRDKKKD